MNPVRSLARANGASPKDLGGATSYGMYIIGIVVFVFGLIFLLRNVGLLEFAGSFWSIFYPLVIMGVGFIIVGVTYEGKKILNKIKKIFSSVEDKM